MYILYRRLKHIEDIKKVSYFDLSESVYYAFFLLLLFWFKCWIWTLVKTIDDMRIFTNLVSFLGLIWYPHSVDYADASSSFYLFPNSYKDKHKQKKCYFNLYFDKRFLLGFLVNNDRQLLMIISFVVYSYFILLEEQ